MAVILLVELIFHVGARATDPGRARRVRRLSRATQDRIMAVDTSSLVDETLNAIQTVQAFTLEELQEPLRARQPWSIGFHAALQRSRMRARLTAVATMLVFGGGHLYCSVAGRAGGTGAPDMTAGQLSQNS